MYFLTVSYYMRFDILYDSFQGRIDLTSKTIGRSPSLHWVPGEWQDMYPECAFNYPNTMHELSVRVGVLSI
jgi:hypothetical protein